MVFKRYLSFQLGGSTTVSLTPEGLCKADVTQYKAASGSTGTDASTHRFYTVRLDSVRVWSFDGTSPGVLEVQFPGRLSGLGSTGSASSSFSLVSSGVAPRNAMECIPDGLNGSVFYGHAETNELCKISRTSGLTDYGIVAVCSFK